MKRAADLLAALVALILLAPIIVVVALAIRAKVGSPILFRQTRPGLDGRPFELLKFRTMIDERHAQGRPLDDQARLTPFGAALRAASLDELPQLWNVVRGDMSIVGPRPLLMEYLPLYSKAQARRHEVRPGITGWTQVTGRNALSWNEKFAADIWYVDNRSFALDLKILLLTVRALLGRRGVSATGHVTMPRFEGNGPRSTNGGAT